MSMIEKKCVFIAYLSREGLQIEVNLLVQKKKTSMIS